jgi:cytochrome c-type protein NapC
MVRGVFRTVGGFIAGRRSLIAIAAVLVIAGVVLSAGYATAVQYTSSQAFCANSCHEMERTVAREYAHTKHFNNGKGAAVTCAQCHTPQDSWQHAAWNELSGASRLWAHVVEREYLPGRFEARREYLSKKVLAGFASSNARECKSCHVYATMVRTAQSQPARNDHLTAMKSDANCLECHKGVAHQRMDSPASYDFP